MNGILICYYISLKYEQTVGFRFASYDLTAMTNLQMKVNQTYTYTVLQIEVANTRPQFET